MAGSYAVGVDVGGTKKLAGEVDYKTGEKHSTVKKARPTEGPDVLMQAIVKAIAGALEEAPKDVARNVKRIGLGLAGQVNPAKGVLRAAPNLGGGITSDVPVSKPLNDLFGVPIGLGND